MRQRLSPEGARRRRCVQCRSARPGRAAHSPKAERAGRGTGARAIRRQYRNVVRNQWKPSDGTRRSERRRGAAWQAQGNRVMDWLMQRARLAALGTSRAARRTWLCRPAPAAAQGAQRSSRISKRLIHVAEDAARAADDRLRPFAKPHGADWAWRPAALVRARWPCPGLSSVPSKSTLGDEVTLFHDCARSELACARCATRARRIWRPMACAWMCSPSTALSVAVLDLPPGLRRAETAASDPRRHDRRDGKADRDLCPAQHPARAEYRTDRARTAAGRGGDRGRIRSGLYQA